MHWPYPTDIRLASGVSGAEDDLAWAPKLATAYQSWELHRAWALAQALPMVGGASGVWEQLSRTSENMKNPSPALLSPTGVQKYPPLPGYKDG